MKHALYSFITLIAGMAFNLYAQECDIPIMVQVADNSTRLSDQNKHILESKLSLAIAGHGTGCSKLSHICLNANVNETSKEVISGTRPLVATSFDITLTLTNLLTGENFESTILETSGSGNSEQQAIRSAFGKIRQANPDLKNFLTSGRMKIEGYYIGAIPKLCNQARSLGREGKYEDAFYILSTVPPCTPGYEQIEETTLELWKGYVDKDCAEKMSMATTIWNTNKTEEGARMAAAYLAAIDHRSACVESAKDLLAQISAKLNDNERRRIELENRILSQEDEDRAFEKEMRREENELRRIELENALQIGLSMSEHVLEPLLQSKGNERDRLIRDHHGRSDEKVKGKSPVVINIQ